MSHEPMDSQRVAADLSSTSPDVVARALAGLHHLALRRPVVPVPVPDVRVLEVFGDRPPEPVVTDLVLVLLDYPLFDPPLDQTDRLAAALEAAVPFGFGQPAHEVARFVRSRDDPNSAVEEFMQLALDADPDDPRTLDALHQIVDVLLEARATHQATVRGLEGWAFRGRYPTVIDGVIGALTDAERARLDQAGGSGSR